MKHVKWQLYRWKYDIRDWLQKNFPLKIKRKFPKPPGKFCSMCGEPLNKICAYIDCDAVYFTWECENNCYADEEFVVGWWPFLFGVWVKTKDLERVGIEII